VLNLIARLLPRRYAARIVAGLSPIARLLPRRYAARIVAGLKRGPTLRRV
jgi:hypothetical protein